MSRFRYFKTNVFLVFVSLLFLLSCNQNKVKKVESSMTKVDSVAFRIDSISKLIRKTPTSDTLFKQRAYLYVLTGDVDNAVNDFELALKVNPNKLQNYLELAEIELRKGQAQLAINNLKKCLKRFPENVETMSKLAYIYIALDKFKEARTLLVKASRIEPNNAKLYVLSSMIFSEIGNIPRAIRELQFAVKYNPNYYEAHNMLGVLNAKLGKDIAIDHYNNAINLNPKNSLAIYNLGMFYQQKENYDKAIEVYKRGLNTIDSTLLNFNFNIGYIFENYKLKFDSALYYYNKIITYYPKDVRVYFHIGQTYEKLKNDKSAMANYEKCLKINPKYDDAYNALSRLSKKINVNNN